MTLTWQSTAAYGVRLLSGRAQIAALSKDNPEHGTARAFIYELLKMTGIGREIESRAISGARKEIESGPMVAGADGQYHVLTGTDSAMA
ncbi:MAG TPA: hypothetical protein VGS19_37000, partial [Streptosporangiaceae bacterium]|nr:hypothetical protein [Streptosporangiaceae bacterium]